MRIGINGYEAVVPRFGYNENGLPNRVGSSIYCYELLIHLNKIDKKNSYIIYLPQNPTKDMPEENENWKYKVISAKKAWTLTSLSLEFLKKQTKPDVFFSPTHYLPITAPAKSVISILDVSYLHFPNLFAKKDLYQLKVWGGFSIKRAKKILTISSSSKSDIIKGYGLPSEKVIVVYPGIKKISNIIRSTSHSTVSSDRIGSGQEYQISNMDELRKKFGIEKDYILFVGTLQPRKNIVRLIEAFSKVVKNYSSSERSESRSQFSTGSNNKGLQLVIVGKRGWQYEEILNAPEKFGIKDKVLFIDNAADEDLPSFYKNAIMFVLPSLYEGFGLPILEAMQYGCPVITSNISSLPEAGGEAAVYVDPENVEDISKKMEKLLEDENLRNELIKKGYEQVKKFSWEKSARQTLAVLEEVAKT